MRTTLLLITSTAFICFALSVVIGIKRVNILGEVTNNDRSYSAYHYFGKRTGEDDG